MGRTPRELDQTLTLKEMAWFAKYAESNSIGNERIELLLATLTCRVFNYLREKNKPAMRVDDFLPSGRKRRQQTPEEITAVLTQATAIANARFK